MEWGRRPPNAAGGYRGIKGSKARSTPIDGDVGYGTGEYYTGCKRRGFGRTRPAPIGRRGEGAGRASYARVMRVEMLAASSAIYDEYDNGGDGAARAVYDRGRAPLRKRVASE